MNEKTRIKELRKSLGLTLEKFGSRIGLKKSSLSAIETGRNSLTEQNIISICREFNVDYIWLTTGEGEMFSETNREYEEMIARIMAGENETAINVFKMFAKFTEADWKALQHMIDLYSSVAHKKPGD